jgi:protein-disulfide isomerase
MHDGLFENQRSLGAPLYLALAAALDLPEDELRVALATGVYAPNVKSDFIGGVRSGVNGTPCYFIDGRRHNGSYDFEELASAVDAALKQARAAI